MNQNPAVTSWRSVVSLNLSASEAAALMGCNLGTAIKRIRQARYQLAANAAIIAHANSRDARIIAARQCGLATITVALSDIDDAPAHSNRMTPAQKMSIRRIPGSAHDRAKRVCDQYRTSVRGEYPVAESLEIVLTNPLGRRADSAAN